MEKSQWHRVMWMAALLTGIMAASGAAGATHIPSGALQELSLDRVTQLALSRNLGLKVQRLEPDKADQTVRSAESVFDPYVTLSTDTGTLQTDDDAQDTDSWYAGADASVEKQLPEGTAVGISLELQDNHTRVDSGGRAGGRYAAGTLYLSHPLMKNRGRDVNTRDITLARNRLHRQQLALKQAAIDTVAQSRRLYWQYYQTLSSLSVYRRSLELARRFLEEMEEKVRVGRAARLDILQARAEAASREEAVIRAENQVTHARDQLLIYIYGELPHEAPVTCVSLPEKPGDPRDVKALVHDALKRRTDLQIADLDLAAADVDIVYFQNQTRPDLSLDFSLGINEGRPEGTLSVSEQYRNHIVGRVGATLKFPWGRRREKADLASARLTRQQARIARQAVVSTITLEVRAALRDLKTAVKQMDANRVAAAFSEESLAAETEKFRNGLSTSYNVLLAQRDLIQARVRADTAVVGGQVALINLHQAVGDTLESDGIRWAGDLE